MLTPAETTTTTIHSETMMETSKKSSLLDLDSSSLTTSAPDFIPNIDFSAFSGDDCNPFAMEATAKKLVDAFAKSGFVYLSNHGLSKEDANKMFSISRQFFDKDLEYKLNLEWESAESNRGYVPQGREKLSELDKAGRAEEIRKLKEINPDLKESYEYGRDDDAQYKNQVPDADWPEFGQQCNEFFKKMHSINANVMSAIGMGLGLGKDYFEKTVDKSDNTLRLLRYPSVPITSLSDETTRRAGAHCDYGSITLLLQDGTGGLEVFDSSKNEFVKATPIPDTIIVNVGDMLQRWSNDHLKSTLHRVVKPYVTANDTHYPSRYSIAYFANPNFDCMIDCLPTCQSASNPAKYEAVNAFDYLVSRLNNTYN